MYIFIFHFLFIVILSFTLDNVVEQTANLIEFKTEVNTKLDALKEVKEVTKENCYEIAKIKSVM